MAYDSSKPLNDGYLAEFPPEMREQLRAIINDQIVDALKLKGYSPGNASGNIPLNNGTVNINLNAQQLNGHADTYFAVAGHGHSDATTSTSGFMSATSLTKLNGIAAGAEVNQNAFSNVVVGAVTVAADSKTDTLTLVSGANISITGDASADSVTIAATGLAPTSHANAATTYGIATATLYGHAMASSATPLIAGTASAGTDNGKFAREGHIHPAQTTVSGNAGTATILQTARTIGISGDGTGTATSFNGSANITIPFALNASGVVAGTYKVVTVDAKGRVTAGSNPAEMSPIVAAMIFGGGE